MPAHSCVLCDVLAGRDNAPARAFISKDELSSEIIASSAEFAAVADVAPLGPGHTMLLTRRHIPAMGQLPADALTELRSVLALFTTRLHTLYSLPVQAFEHGFCGEPPDTGCGIDHAHLHLLPTTADLVAEFHQDFAVRNLGRLTELARLRSLGAEYLLLIPPSGEILTAFPRGTASQYFRKKVSTLTGRELWNWNDELLLGQAARCKQWILELHRLWDSTRAADTVMPGVAPANP
jgi:diadenosine tetraphosphate (Ap4A) HIT family hydrolase